MTVHYHTTNGTASAGSDYAALVMELTEAFQLLPEQSTAAVIIHHPEAKYYAVRGASTGAGAEPEAAVA